MKHLQQLICQHFSRTLYPTWFRWNLTQSTLHLIQMKHFISHMVQMKHRVLQPQCHIFPCFISHMVQMKLVFLFILATCVFTFISHMVQMKLLGWDGFWLLLLSLYPTWFRWNLNSIFEVQHAGITLYPTWFRWNSLSLSLNFQITQLYIPHGSDETL